MTDYDPKQLHGKAMEALYEDLICCQPGERVQLYKVDIRNIVAMMQGLGEEHVSVLEDLTGLKLHQMQEQHGFDEIYQPKGDLFYILCTQKDDPQGLGEQIQTETSFRPDEADHSKTVFVDISTGMKRSYDHKLPKEDEVCVNPAYSDTAVTWIDFPAPEMTTPESVEVLAELLAHYNTMAKKLSKGDENMVFGERIEDPEVRRDDLRRIQGTPVDYDFDVVSDCSEVRPPPLPGQELKGDPDLDGWLQ